MIVVNYFKVHKSDVSWKPFDVRKKIVVWIEKIFLFDLLFICWGYCFFFADCTIFDAVKRQAEIRNTLIDVIS